MDSKPDIASLLPIAVDVEQGKTYHWCGCGHSAKQPLCDKQECAAKSVCFKAELTEAVLLCCCKHTKSPPYCDGSHAALVLNAMKQK